MSAASAFAGVQQRIRTSFEMHAAEPARYIDATPRSRYQRKMDSLEPCARDRGTPYRLLPPLARVAEISTPCHPQVRSH